MEIIVLLAIGFIGLALLPAAVRQNRRKSAEARARRSA
jgi:hypothetical protein